MKIKALCVLFSVLFCLSSCGGGRGKAEQTDTQAKAESTETASKGSITDSSTSEATVQDNPDVSKYADNIAYLDLDNSSWERTHPIEMVMVHFTSAVVLDRENPYDMSLVRKIFDENEIGIHYIISRDGEINCWLPENREAWHAGKGSTGDPKYDNCFNFYSIGIEILAMGDRDEMSKYLLNEEYDAIPDEMKGYTKKQYEALKKLLEDITKRYDIPYDREHIIGHDEYSSKKTDPGKLFDWSEIGL